MTSEQDAFRRRAVRAALTVVGIAVVLGLVVGGLTTGALYLTGVLPPSEPSRVALPEPDQSEEDELPTPSLAPTASPSPSERSGSPSAAASPSPSGTGASETGEAKPTPTESREPRRSRKPRRDDTPIRLRTGQRAAGTFERVTLSGRYPDGNGTSLQVQRREGGKWRRFPTTATVRGGRFRTYVASGRPGPNAFRVADSPGGPVSNVVVVTVS